MSTTAEPLALLPTTSVVASRGDAPAASVPPSDTLRADWDRLLAEGERLAGGLHDLAQRAAVYHHLFEDSGRNHVFPLIAAHGALWARGWFAFGFRLARGLLVLHPFSAARRSALWRGLEGFADAFRDINRRVCLHTYAVYHFTALHGSDPGAERFVSGPLLAAMNRVHAARRAGVELPDAAKREVFETFFRNEQESVVGPSLEAAVQGFSWSAMKSIALRPIIRFAYFPGGRRLFFGNFSRREERIANGLRAFDFGAQVGWRQVEAALRDYAVLPDRFFAGSAAHFAALRRTVLAGA